MRNLIEKLRQCAENCGQSNSQWWQNEASDLMLEAATEIGQLEATIAELQINLRDLKDELRMSQDNNI